MSDFFDNDEKNVTNLVGNVYQSISGSHKERVETISKWIDSLRNAYIDWDSQAIVEQVLENQPYLRK